MVAALAGADRVLIATHENPDGDAIGSMTAAAAPCALGKEVRTYLEPESNIPHEVAFLEGTASSGTSTPRRSPAGHCSPSTAATSAGWGRSTPTCWPAARR